ncbi:MAG: metal ABC transporter permease [Geminicoccaceae bacterium]|nr:metal ABC transporter permease [Geminicoccaceae bacterium]MDW8124217.1 metal ABC transporter permease [Geminicoccaceae bacterium]
MLGDTGPGIGLNTLVVASGAGLLGAGGGVLGTFLLYRRRVMLADAAGHATLPGVVLAFLVGLALFGEGRVPVLLFSGAVLSAASAGLLVETYLRTRRLPEDAATASVLATFYGAGLVLLDYVQALPVGGQAGLERLLLGSAASMLRAEAELLAAGAFVLLVVLALSAKEFRLLCFDPGFADAHGWSSRRLDLLLTGLLLVQIALALPIVGLVLALALVATPPVIARLWVDRLSHMLGLAALVGGFGACAGVFLSALLPRLPTGATVVLVLAALLAASLGTAPRRGWWAVALRRRALRRRSASVGGKR